MPEVRLTKAEKAALVEKALREKARRQGANRRARADRIAKGRRRIEKTVPVLFLPEIRGLVAAVLTELEAGREPRLRRGDPLPPTEQSAQDVFDEPGPTTAPPPGTRGLGPAARRRAQIARRRERQRAAGLVRTTFDVPTALVNTISEIVDRTVIWMSEGRQVILEDRQVHTDVVPLDPAREPVPTHTTVALVLDDLTEPEGDRSEMSPLFEDIQAAARLEWLADRARPFTEPASHDYPRTTVPPVDMNTAAIVGDGSSGKFTNIERWPKDGWE